MPFKIPLPPPNEVKEEHREFLGRFRESELSEHTAKQRLYDAVRNCNTAKTMAEATAKMLIRQARAQ
jgi:hypothetical protein